MPSDEDPYISELFTKISGQPPGPTAPDALREEARQDYQRNVISPPIDRWDEYMKYWKEFEAEARKPQGDWALSPRQLREKGIKP